MPTYDYRCGKCGHVFEVFHGIKDTAPRRCPRCRGRAQRVPSAGAGILFKGSGFYITDYRSRDYRERAKKEKGAAESTGSGPAGGATTPGQGGTGDAGGKPHHKGPGRPPRDGKKRD